MAVELREREGELSALGDAVAHARAGTGVLVLVEGPAGIGKSSLLAAGRDRAARAGLRVAAARASELERDFPYGVVRQLLEPPLAERSADRAALLDGAAALAAPLFDPARVAEPSPGDPTFPLLHGLYWLCANLAAEQP